jgi:hypothetical protein
MSDDDPSQEIQVNIKGTHILLEGDRHPQRSHRSQRIETPDRDIDGQERAGSQNGNRREIASRGRAAKADILWCGFLFVVFWRCV